MKRKETRGWWKRDRYWLWVELLVLRGGGWSCGKGGASHHALGAWGLAQRGQQTQKQGMRAMAATTSGEEQMPLDRLS